MKYFNIETAKNQPNLIRNGRITFADKYRKSGKGFAYLKCNGKKLYVPYENLDEETIKALHVSCPVNFRLATDGERVWAVDVNIEPHPDRDLRNLFHDLPNWPYDPIKVKSIKKIEMVNKFYDLPKELQTESDNKEIPRKFYEAIKIETINDRYLIFGGNSPIKGDYKVDDLYSFMNYILTKLNVGPYEPIEKEKIVRERDNNEKMIKEMERNIKLSVKDMVKIETVNTITPPDFDSKIYAFSYGDKYTLSYNNIVKDFADVGEYYGYSEEEFLQRIKEHKGYVNESGTLIFPNISQANGMAKQIIIDNEIRKCKLEYMSKGRC